MPDALQVLLVVLVGGGSYAALLSSVVAHRRREEARADHQAQALQRFAPGRHAGTYDPSSDLAPTTWR